MRNFSLSLFFLGIIITIVGAISLIDARNASVTAASDILAYAGITREPDPLPSITPPLAETVASNEQATSTPSSENSEEVVTEDPAEESPETPQATATNTPSFLTILPATTIIGSHEVQPGETLLCIGRAYAVDPEAIALANGLSPMGVLTSHQMLIIPNVPWEDIMLGPICPAQFNSPFTVPPATVTATPSPTASTTPTAQPVVPTETPRPLPTATAVSERRQIVVDVPSEMVLGESLELILTFNPKAGRGAEEAVEVTTVPVSTPGLERLVVPQPVQNVRHFVEHRLWATARLDAAGFTVSPEREITYPVRQGEPLAWRWSIRAQEAEQQTVIVSLWLAYESKEPDVESLTEGMYWSAPYTIDVKSTFFGVTATLQETASLLGIFLGLALSATELGQFFMSRPFARRRLE